MAWPRPPSRMPGPLQAGEVLASGLQIGPGGDLRLQARRRKNEGHQVQVPPTTMYERLGGMAFFETLTERFYKAVAQDEVLRPLYPEDLEPPRRHLCLFLAQFFGGPRVYDAERGNPMLRARHLPFKIGAKERDHWLEHMTAAVKEAHIGALDEAQVLGYFASASSHMINAPD
jgi:hemoglobin